MVHKIPQIFIWEQILNCVLISISFQLYTILHFTFLMSADNQKQKI